MSEKKKPVRVFAILLTVLLVVLSAFVLFVRMQNQKTVRSAQGIVSQIEQLLPPPSPGILEELNHPALSALEIDGTDYVGVLEYRTSGRKFPVYADWGNLPFSPRPALFSGSAYDGTLIIGGRNQKGQFDFCERIDVGEQFVFTDVKGQQFNYTVVKIEHSPKNVSDHGDRADLTLFVKIPFSTNILIRCKLG